MLDFNYIFENKTIDFDYLSKLGFLKLNGSYIYKVKIIDNNFLLKIKITKTNNINITLEDVRFKKAFSNLNQIADLYTRYCVKAECEYHLGLINELCFNNNELNESKDNEIIKKSLRLHKDYLTLCRLFISNKRYVNFN